MRTLALAAAALVLTSFAALAAVDSTATADTSRTPEAGRSLDRGALSSGRGTEDAAGRFRTLVELEGGALEQAYREQTDLYRRQAAAAEALTGRIAAVEAAGEALFAEWEAELGQYATDSLRTLGRARLDSARAEHARRLASMREAEQAAAPALAAFRDRTLALKHALSARAVGALAVTAEAVQADAGRVRTETERAVVEADRLLATTAR